MQPVTPDRAIPHPNSSIFPQSKNYDAHHLMSAIGKTEQKETVCTDKNGEPLTYKDLKGVEKKQTVKDGKITAIVQNMEKLISFNWGQYKFVDSYAFLSSSLDRLVAKYTQGQSAHHKVIS